MCVCVCVCVLIKYHVYLSGGVCLPHFNYMMTKIGLKIRGSLITTIYRKTLAVNSITLSQFRFLFIPVIYHDALKKCSEKLWLETLKILKCSFYLFIK